MMMSSAGRMPGMPGIPDNPLLLSWHDSNWIPILNASNVLEYFSENSNPFYNRTCNNEIIKMQRQNPEQLLNMTGLEYRLIHVQEPILYVIRKQHRHSPTEATPIAHYYIIAGKIYQAPDLASVLNCRILDCVYHLQSSFEEASGFSRYHPSKGYTWDFKSQRSDKPKAKDEKPREEPSSLFQRQRVDMLLGELITKFPVPPVPTQKNAILPVKTESENGGSTTGAITNNANSNSIAMPIDTKDIKTEKRPYPDVKSEKIKPPPEKKPRLN